MKNYHEGKGMELGFRLTTNYICDLCKFSFESQKAIVHHMQSIHGTKVPQIRQTCNQCEVTFSQGYNKNRHMRAVHGGEKGPKQIGKPFIFQCPECRYKFSKQYDGCSSHSKRATFTCEICGYITTQMSQLKDHQASSRCDTQKSVVKSFPCSHCPLGFTTEKAMIRHEKQHVDGKPFKCEHCEIGFSQNYGLTTHLKKGRCKVQKKYSTQLEANTQHSL
jgi:KRAB domain-containing zinc finger protein